MDALVEWLFLWSRMERRLAAIVAVDVVGFSRLMGADEAGTLEQLRRVRAECVETSIAEHHGRIFKLTGDGLLAEFPSVVGAVECAAEIQRELRASQGGDRFRIGVNLGDVIVDDGDIYGDGVNVAARMESVARPGGVAVSESVRAQIGNRLDAAFEDRGEQQLEEHRTADAGFRCRSRRRTRQPTPRIRRLTSDPRSQCCRLPT